MNNKYFTKSAFKLAFECPTKLYYACDNSYANQDVDNEFLQALANGGFQVGELAKIYFYAKSMKGSNSIKDVLPAVLNASKFIQQKYSQPIYGSEIHSENIPADVPISWISVTDGVVDNPYKKLPPVAYYLNMTEKEMQEFAKYSGSEISEDETIAQGGAALTAYAKLQFSNLEDSEALTKAFLRYCELDTMAMVFIWEYFYHKCFPQK